MPATIEVLSRRALLLQRTREFFNERSFLEVTTPVLSPEVIVDEHIDPYEVTMYQDPTRAGVGESWYLRTSPEAHMKRLVAAGASAIYQIGPVFRACEHGPLHNPEFTMLEWYRVGDDLDDAMALLMDLWRAIMPKEWHRYQKMTYRDAFKSVLQIDPIKAPDDDIRQLSQELSGPAASSSRDEHLNFLLAEQVAPKLSRGMAALVHGFPASQAALAQIDPHDVATAHRFELYFRGIELANGYLEVVCAEEMLRRFAAANALRQKAGKPSLRGDTKLAEALRSRFPRCSGVALGFDRLVLMALDEKKLDSVIAFDLSLS